MVQLKTPDLRNELFTPVQDFHLPLYILQCPTYSYYYY